MNKTISDVIYLPVDKLKPYENNSRNHSARDINAIVASIHETGFNDPIGIWGKDNIIVEGHGRLEAAKKLGLETVPCIRLDHLTDQQRRAYAIFHNRTAEMSEWDFDIRSEELAELTEIDMSAFEFGFTDEIDERDWFEREHKEGSARQEGNEEYNAFLEKFEAKKTTDDCYTPNNIYDAVADWVAEEYGLDRKDFVRPFFPGGDYERYTYPEGCVVVDNPPFSILASIIRFYMERGIKFFLFAPTLTLFSSGVPGVTFVGAECDITYENGACVNTSFKTNLEPDTALRTAPQLTARLKEENLNNTNRKAVPKYEYPPHVIRGAVLSKWSAAGVEFKAPWAEVYRISELDAQKEYNKGVFGGGFILSTAQAEKVVQAEKAAQAAQAARDVDNVWELSDREKEIVKRLDNHEGIELARENKKGE